MFQVASLAFWLNFVYFWFLVFIAFYIPGSALLRQFSFRKSIEIPLAVSVGMMFWAIQGFVFGYLGIRWMSYGYVLFFSLFWIFFQRERKINILNDLANLGRIIVSHKTVFLIILLGSFVQLTTIWMTGILRPDGAYFCCGDANDNAWFASVTVELIDRFPPDQPGMYGVPLKNYHYWSNLVVAELARVFHLPFFNVQYQFMSALLSLLFGIQAVIFSKLVKLKKTYAQWLLFFLYFGSDAIYILLLLLGKGIDFSMSSLEDGARFLANLPRAYSVVLFMTLLNVFIIWVRGKKQLWTTVVLGILFGTLIGFKVYTGIFALIGLGVFSLYMLLFQKSGFGFLLLFSALMSAFQVYIPVNATAGGMYFVGLWRFENFIVQKSLGLIRWELARKIYQDHFNWLQVIRLELTYVFIYIFAIFGMKTLGLLQTRQSLRRFSIEIHIMLIPAMIISVVVGIFFMQSVGTSNTFNFLVSVFIFSSYYAALATDYLTDRMKPVIATFFISILILCSIPRIVFETTKNYLDIIYKHGWFISNNDLNTARYLKESTGPNSLIMLDFEKYWYDQNAPMMHVLSFRPMFYSGRGLLKHFQESTDVREKITNEVFKNKNPIYVGNLLASNNIDYILTSSFKMIASTESASFLIPVYQNETNVILKVDKNAIYSLYPNIDPSNIRKK